MFKSKLAARTLMILGLGILALLAGRPGSAWAEQIYYGPWMIPWDKDPHKMNILVVTGQGVSDPHNCWLSFSYDHNTQSTPHFNVYGTWYNYCWNERVCWRAEVTNLTPGTYYQFTFYCQDDDGNVTSAPGGFMATRDKDGVGCSPVEFLALGDNRSETNGDVGLLMKWVLKDAVNQYNFHPEFMVHTGDICYNGGGNSYSDLTDYWDRSIGSDSQWAWILARYPLMVALGNHDFDYDSGSGTDMDYFHYFFPYPHASGGGVGDEYTYNVNGQVWFFDLDTFPMDGYCGCGNGCPGLKPGSDQYKWLDQTLSSIDNDPRQWKIVFMHAPLYSPGDCNLHGPNIDLENLLEKHGVDLVLTGHEHYYSRITVSCDGNNQPINNNIIHLVLGGAGASLSKIEDTTGYDRVVQDWHFADIKIDGDVLQGRVVFRGDVPDDTFTIDRTPHAHFNCVAKQDPTTGKYVAQFYDMSTGHRYLYDWFFGDGPLSQSSERSPQHVYAQAGTYKVQLNIWSAWNESWVNSTVQIPTPPEVQKSLPSSILGLLLLDDWDAW
jgi:hypothetical protein